MDLKFVIIINRHGDRSPLMNYYQNTQNEKTYDSYWESTVFIINIIGS